MAATALALGLATTVWSSSAPVLQFNDASAVALAADGVTLGQAQSSPPMSEEAAAALATQAGHRPILQAQYVHCTLTDTVPAADEDCWAFSLDPSGLASTTGVPATYFIVMVDPNSGKILLSGWGAG